MSFANPQALWLLVLLPIPLLVARRPRARPHGVSNLYLWRTSADPDAVSLKVRSVRRRWLAVVQMAVIATTIVALARPGVSALGERIAFVFDVSASMSARDGRITRFDAARERAYSRLARLSNRSRVRLIAAGVTARELGEYAASDPSLRREIEHLTPAAGAADISGGVALAARSAPDERIVVFSDRVDDVAPAEKTADVTWDIAGTAADNLAISRVVARRRPSAPMDGDVLVAVHNYGSHAQRADVEIAQDGQVIDRRTIAIERDREETILVNVPRIGRVIRARLTADDALAVDNERADVVPPVEPIRVGFAGRRNSYVEKALAADRAIALEPSSQADDLIVCGCAEPPRAGNVLLLPADRRAFDAGLLAVVNPDHPIAAELSFVDVTAGPAPGADGGDVVVRAGGVPAVVASERDGRRIVDLRFDPSSETAVNTAFPILIANAVRWLDGRHDNPTQVAAGEPLQWTLPDAGSSISVTGPDGKPRTAQVQGRAISVVDTGVPGVYHVRTPNADRLFAVNPVVEGESDLRTTGGGTSSPTGARRPYSSGGVAMMRLLLALGAVLVIVEWYVDRRRPVRRAAVAACLAVAASGLAVVPQAASVDVVAVLDRSRSIPVRAQQQTLARLRAAASTLRHGDRVGIVGFGADALVESPLAEAATWSSPSAPVVDTDTDIAAGLRLARTMLPPRGPRRIVLFSDGRQTLGNAEREAAFLAAEGIPVDAAAIDTSNAIRVPAVSRVVAPAYARINEPFAVTVEVTGPPDARAELTLYRDEQVMGTRELRVPPSGIAIETFADKAPAGVHVLRATVDSQSEEAGAIVSVSGEPSVLYVSRAPGVIEPVLASAGFQITRAAPGSLPRGPNALLRYDAVVLDDVPSDELGTASAEDIAQYVDRYGGGLLLLGSSRTLDIGGYPIGPLGSSLPIDFRRRSGQRGPAFGLVLVFDKSGSMSDQAGGASKIERAREAVMRVLDVLPPTDSLGVIAFDAQPVVVTPLTPRQNAADVAEKLQAIVPGGPTQIAPAASLAARWLNDPDVKAAISRRQILLLSDGLTSSGDAEQLRAAVAAAGVEVSVVAIGANSNRSLLQQLADSTGGRAYFPSDLADLPKIVAREAARSRSGGIVEESFALRSTPHPVLSGLDRESLPRLSGYVVGAAKSSAVSVLSSHLDDPILCAWQYGLGRVAVFTGDLASSWSSPLRAWRGFGRLWVQSTRWLSRSLDDRELRVSTARDGHALRFVVAAEREDGSAIDLVDARASLQRPDGRTSDVAFEESAPGRYTARVDATTPGAYTLSFGARDRDRGSDHHLVTGVFRSDDQERSAVGTDNERMSRVARITGGRVLAASENPFAVRRPAAFRDVSIWLTAAALAMYLAGLLLVPWVAGKFLPHGGRRLRRPVQNLEAV